MPHYKQAMDIRFVKHPKIEREYQQAVVRDNNRHASGDRSDYMVVDIEYAQSPGAFPDRASDFRFDMVGLRWPVILTQNGRSAAVLLDVDVYESLIDELAVLRDVRTAEQQLDAGMGIPHDDVERRLRDKFLK